MLLWEGETDVGNGCDIVEGDSPHISTKSFVSDFNAVLVKQPFNPKSHANLRPTTLIMQINRFKS